ncbi:hypothetical protein HDK64DRAFT_262867 [Phyllosticta capitalensis]
MRLHLPLFQQNHWQKSNKQFRHPGRSPPPSPLKARLAARMNAELAAAVQRARPFAGQQPTSRQQCSDDDGQISKKSGGLTRSRRAHRSQFFSVLLLLPSKLFCFLMPTRADGPVDGHLLLARLLLACRLVDASDQFCSTHLCFDDRHARRLGQEADGSNCDAGAELMIHLIFHGWLPRLNFDWFVGRGETSTRNGTLARAWVPRPLSSS